MNLVEGKWSVGLVIVGMGWDGLEGGWKGVGRVRVLGVESGCFYW